MQAWYIMQWHPRVWDEVLLGLSGMVRPKSTSKAPGSDAPYNAGKNSHPKHKRSSHPSSPAHYVFCTVPTTALWGCGGKREFKSTPHRCWVKAGNSRSCLGFSGAQMLSNATSIECNTDDLELLGANTSPDPGGCRLLPVASRVGFTELNSFAHGLQQLWILASCVHRSNKMKSNAKHCEQARITSGQLWYTDWPWIASCTKRSSSPSLELLMVQCPVSARSGIFLLAEYFLMIILRILPRL